jgi:antitoxin (DNA-binding transcriptional repressor) of toxin-antitoxin stability system
MAVAINPAVSTLDLVRWSGLRWPAMKTMVVSKFKAKCIATLKEIQRTREPMLITLRGKPLVTVQPVEARGRGKRPGSLKGRMTVRRDLVKTDTTGDWDMLQ